jgi:hypothetical protein
MKMGLKSRVVLALVAAACVVPASASSQSSAHHHKVVQPPVVTPPPLPPGPLTPLTLEQQPTIPPQVTYRNNQLTILAQNSTLADVLRAVRTQTGAAVDIPSNATERVVGHFGPGPARDVLAALLNGSPYNYVLLGSAANPNALEHVILISQSGGAAPVETAAQAPPQPGDPNAEPEDSLEGLNDMQGEDVMSDQDQQSAQAEGQGAETQPADQGGFQFNGGQPGGGVRSPQQMLQDLQRQQQQQSGQPFSPAPVGGTTPNQPPQQ